MKFLSLSLVAVLLAFAMPQSALAQAKALGEPQINARFHPLHLIVNSFGIDLEFRAGENWTAGPSLAFFNKDEDFQSFESRASFIGARGTYTFDHAPFTTGWYLAPIGGIVSVQVEKVDATNTQGKGSQSGILLGGYGGYQYYWGPFSTNLGLGYAFNSTDKIQVGYFDSGRLEDVEVDTFGGFIWEASVGYSW